MAVVNVDYANIADETAVAPWRSALGGASVANPLFYNSGSAAIGGTNDIGSTYRFMKIPSNCVVTDLRLYCAALTSGTAYDLGLYTISDGAVKVDNCYANNIDMSSAKTGTVNYAQSAKAVTVHRQKAWADAGDSADIGSYYDLVLTGDTVGSVSTTCLCTAMYYFD